MEREDEAVSPVLEDQAVLDLHGRHAHKRMGVLLASLVGAGGVDQSNDGAARIDDRRRHATQEAVGSEEMLTPVDGGGLLRLESETKGVGATRVFAPDAARDDVAPGRTVGEDLIA